MAVLQKIKKQLTPQIIGARIKRYIRNPKRFLKAFARNPLMPLIIALGAYEVGSRTKLERIAKGGYPAELLRAGGMAGAVPLISSAPILPSLIALSIAAKGGHMTGRLIEKIIGKHKVPPRLARKILPYTGD